MSSIQYKFFLSACFFIFSITSYAQIQYSKFEIGVGANAFIYQGDLTPSFLGSLKTIQPGASAFVNRFLNQSFSVRANFSYGTLKGNDALYASPAWRRERNFSFSTPVLETTVEAVWNILGKNGSKNNYGFSPYLFAGVGYSFLNIKRDWSKMNTTYFASETRTVNGLIADEAHRLPGGIPVIPMGIGLRYAINQHLSVFTEWTYRMTFTDYLDGFSQSADPSKNDHYHSVSVGLIYTFGEKNRMACPVIKK